VDAQNESDPDYRPLMTDAGTSLAFAAARALILQGAAQPSGYTEPLLHRFRRQAKAAAESLSSQSTAELVSA
jgi:malate synthase